MSYNCLVRLLTGPTALEIDMESSTVLALSFIVYSVGIIAFGLYSTKQRKKTEDDFVLANRELVPAFILAFLMVIIISSLTKPAEGEGSPS